MESENILEAKQVSVAFRIAGKFQKAIYDIDLRLRRGEVLAIVGESGSGKSTIGKTIVGLEQMTSGQLIYKGQDVSKKKIRNQLKYNKDVQM
ncbi:ATP-binding cassette domain-containing protein, partial [Lactococcus lactis]